MFSSSCFSGRKAHTTASWFSGFSFWNRFMTRISSCENAETKNAGQSGSVSPTSSFSHKANAEKPLSVNPNSSVPTWSWHAPSRKLLGTATRGSVQEVDRSPISVVTITYNDTKHKYDPSYSCFMQYDDVTAPAVELDQLAWKEANENQAVQDSKCSLERAVIRLGNEGSSTYDMAGLTELRLLATSYQKNHETAWWCSQPAQLAYGKNPSRKRSVDAESVVMALSRQRDAMVDLDDGNFNFLTEPYQSFWNRSK